MWISKHDFLCFRPFYHFGVDLNRSLLLIVHVQGNDSFSQIWGIIARNCIEIPPSYTGKAANTTWSVWSVPLIHWLIVGISQCRPSDTNVVFIFLFDHLLVVPSGSIASKLEPIVTMVHRLPFLKIPDTPSPILKTKFSSDLKF